MFSLHVRHSVLGQVTTQLGADEIYKNPESKEEGFPKTSSALREGWISYIYGAQTFGVIRRQAC